MKESVSEENRQQSFLQILRGNKEFFSNPITIALSAVVVFFTSQLVGGLLAIPILTRTKDTNLQLLAVISFSTLSLILILLALKKILHFKISSIGIVTPKTKNYLYVVPAFLLYFAASAGFTVLAAHFIPGFDSKEAQDVGFSKNTSGLQMLAAFFSLVVITSIFEEVIFRGLLFKRLRGRLSFRTSVVLASLVFAVAHMQWNVAVDTFALSIVLCWLVEKSDSIIPGIGLHMLKNGIAFTLLFVIK